MKQLGLLVVAALFMVLAATPADSQWQRERWDQMPTYKPPSATKEPPPARAPLPDHTNLELFNKVSSKVRVCINYYDNRRRMRINEGWWEIPAYSSIKITLFTTDPSLAYFAHTLSGRRWEARLGDANAYPTKLVPENFIARAGTVPKSFAPMSVVMTRIRVLNRNHTIIFGP